ncbi:MAG: release factor glutamine methyltransferase [Gammaproteobacteria bacterium]|jgi:release factor glutamine methyltransferase
MHRDESAWNCVANLVRLGERLLSENSNARLDAELLLAHVLGCDRTAVYRDANKKVSPDQQQSFCDLVSARSSGKPLAQIVGVQEFWSLPFVVDENVLIPRPETELLVDVALLHLRRLDRPIVADLGTGSGAIAVAISHECPNATIVAVERSIAALEIAKRNCARHARAPIYLVRANWLMGLCDHQFDLIIANPPYIASGDPLVRTTSIRFEPEAALVSGPDGLDALRQVVAGAARALKSGAVLAVEHGYNQATQVRAQFQQHGFCSIITERDLAGHERVTSGRISGS